ncbi:MAG: aminotransferase class IV [Acidobacteriota bacterium]
MDYVYLNGEFVARAEATMDIEDRGVLFGDGVYEVLRFFNGRPFAMAEHVARLKRSMATIELPESENTKRLEAASEELVERNRITEAKVYWQVTRGTAPRDHAIPPGLRPNVLIITYPAQSLDIKAPPRKLTATLVEDRRWHLCAVKSLMLLPNVLAMREASNRGANVPILHRGQIVTEGAVANVLIVRNGELHTHPANQWILEGVTRGIVLGLARTLGLTAHERTFTIDQLLRADEAIMCGTTTNIEAVIEVDGQLISGGSIGPITRQLHQALLAKIAQDCRL